MAVPRLHRALIAAFATLALVAVLAAPPATASEEPDDADTITTVLHPGWNMVGWVGPETPASELFDEIPSLTGVFAWDRAAEGYRLRARPIVHLLDPLMLAPGQGLWLYLDGEAPVEWRRKASEDSVLLELEAGRNLVAWAGRDGTPIEEATVRFGERFVRAWRWDAEASQYRLYQPDAVANSLTELNHGDALLVELTEDARWWQSGTAPVPVEILGEYTEHQRWQIHGWVDGNRGFFAERWGVEAPVTLYVGDRESVTQVYRRVLGGSGGLPSCGYYTGLKDTIFLVDECVSGGVHAHEYFHAIQFHLMGDSRKAVPGWIREGSAEYALFMYAATPHFKMLYPGHVSPSLTIQERIDEFRAKYAAVGYGHWPTLSETEGGSGPFSSQVYYQLGFLGIAWLAEQVGDQAVVDFFEHLAKKPNWRSAFASAFGMTTHEFHKQFDAYREAAVPVLPHTTDGRDEPVVEFVGEIPAATQSTVLEEFDRVQVFLREQFGAGITDYTVVIFADVDEADEAHMRVFGTEWDRPSCQKQSPGAASILSLRCYRSDLLWGLLRSHFKAARSLTAGARTQVGPYWLFAGAELHMWQTYHVVAGRTDVEDVRRGNASRAAPTQVQLRDLERLGAFREAEREPAYAMSTLAIERLLQHSGGQALFEYYRLLSDSPRWESAFRTAFGLTINEFYRDFEAYRARITPPDEDADPS